MKFDLGHGSRAEGSLPVAAGLAPEIEDVDDEDGSPDREGVRAPRDYEMPGSRTLFISALSPVIGAAGTIVAQVFVRLIGFATNLAYYGRISTAFVDPRLPVVSRENPRLVVGIISRSDLLAAHAPRLSAAHDAKVTAKWR